MGHHTIFADRRRVITLERGQEGPRHDPYGVEEFEVEDRLTGNAAVMRIGSLTGYSILHGDIKVPEKFGEDQAAAVARFAALTGYTPMQWRRFADKARLHCKAGGYHGCQNESGFPGESFEVCRKCNKVVETHFNEGAII